MAKIPRRLQKIFANSATDVGKFGGAKAGDKAPVTDIAAIQSLPAFEGGFAAATYAGNQGSEVPERNEIDGLFKVVTQQIAYTLQEGVAEWDATTRYYVNSIVKSNNILYIAIQGDDINDNTNQVVTNAAWWSVFVAPLTTTLPRRIILSNNTLDPNNSINFSAGNFIFHDFTRTASLNNLTKLLNANWSLGTNQGGLDIGTKAVNTWYYCYAIYNPTTLVSDVIFSTNAALPLLPSGFTKYQYIGSIRTNISANIISFIQTGNYFNYDTAIVDATPGLPSSNVFLTYTLSVPRRSGILANIWATMRYTGGGTVSMFISYRRTGSAGASPIGGGAVSGYTTVDGNAYVPVNDNGSIDINFTWGETPVDQFLIQTLGFIDCSL